MSRKKYLIKTIYYFKFLIIDIINLLSYHVSAHRGKADGARNFKIYRKQIKMKAHAIRSVNPFDIVCLESEVLCSKSIDTD